MANGDPRKGPWSGGPSFGERFGVMLAILSMILAAAAKTWQAPVLPGPPAKGPLEMDPASVHPLSSPGRGEDLELGEIQALSIGRHDALDDLPRPMRLDQAIDVGAEGDRVPLTASFQDSAFSEPVEKESFSEIELGPMGQSKQ